MTLATLPGCGGSTAPVPLIQATYLGSMERSGAYPDGAGPTATEAGMMKVAWSYSASGTISSQPVADRDRLYWASWDGYVHASDWRGREAWRAYVGRTDAPGCQPPAAGSAGTPLLAQVPGLGSVLYVDGGDGAVYALAAATGRRLWRTPLGTVPSLFLWGSPALANGGLLVGYATFGECSEGGGGLAKLGLEDGQVLARFAAAPAGCSGAGVWGAPAVDRRTGLVYVVTGDAEECETGHAWGVSVVAVRGSDLAPVDSWAVPSAELGPDSDFGSTPTLFTAGIDMIGAVNKNGVYYALDRHHLGRGPLWTVRVAQGGECPYCGDGSISSSAWDGQRLLIAGGSTRIEGADCRGSVSAVEPSSGDFLWRTCLPGPVLGAVVASGGLAFVGAGRIEAVVSTNNGGLVGTFQDPDPTSGFLGAAAPLRGRIYVGTAKGRLFALG